MDDSLYSPDDGLTGAKILASAVEAIAARGYHGTSIRDIAAIAKVSSGSIYHHFGSKHDLLVTIINRGGAALLAATEQALFDAPNEPAERLKAIVRIHVGRHAQYSKESLIGNSELRSLSPSARELVVSQRDGQQRMFDRVVIDGVEKGVFLAPDPIEAARFISSACTAVAGWFNPKGPATVDEIIERYQRVALNAVQYQGPGR
ncbi:TetR family transcriptional regulator [Antricoccus suffuscus]|uniref:TetR family transcriptional regulator n=1 Tax=Antricoccus suffuscus TaxID=1629062 RepID=A0A2T1A6H6_9ACTN|nr:TetR family transcriptional regulator [Antricoccus suffuscus]PRZ44201.1 TetR family transcriptional regulator [Antricoccus suffuscus]